MQHCDTCPKNWDCEEPCEKVIGWEELPPEDKIQVKYVPKGIVIQSYASSRRDLEAKLQDE